MGLLLAVRLIDLAILGSLGGLWVGGAVFIYVLYRWILRYERSQGTGDDTRAVPSPELAIAPSVRAEERRPSDSRPVADAAVTAHAHAHA